MQNKIYIGIDGGASKTAGVLINHDGNCLAYYSGSACVFNSLPSESALTVIRQAVQALLDQAGASIRDLEGIGLGVNGVDLASDWVAQHAAIAQTVQWPRERLSLVNDGVVALWGGCGVEAAAVLQHGSGFTAAYRSAWGAEQPFDHLNMGKVFDIRRQLYIRVARMIDGRCEVTALQDRVLNHFKIKAQNFHETVFRNQIQPSLSRESMGLLCAAYESHDPAAIDLFDLALEDYALAANAMLRLTGSQSAHLILGGGVLTRFPAAALEQLTQRIQVNHPETQVGLPELTPAHGGALMAAFKAGANAQSLFQAIKKGRSHDAPCP